MAPDAQCGPDQVCAEQVTYNCAEVAPAPACPPNEKCEPSGREPADCTPVTQSYCTLRWQLPCTVAAACGAGFECVPQESCSTSGSSGGGSAGTPTPGTTPTAPAGAATPPAPSTQSSSPPSSGGADPVPPDGDRALPAPPTVTCEPTGYSACVPIQTACTTDADCVAGWRCNDNPNGVCWSGPDGTGCTPADPPKLCQPPYDASGGGPGRGEGTPSSGNPGPDPAPTAPGVPSVPPSKDDSGLGATPVPANPANGESANGDSNASESGGCSMSATPATASGLAWLALGLAGMFGVRRRRR